MYNPDSWEDSTVYKCPTCGRFCSPEDSYYDVEDCDDDPSLTIAFCNKPCANRWHTKKTNQRLLRTVPMDGAKTCSGPILDQP
jgi:hypothetical protein